MHPILVSLLLGLTAAAANVFGGAIIVQKTVPVLDTDDEHKLAERILEQEHVAYTEAIRIVLDGTFDVVGRRLKRK